MITILHRGGGLLGAPKVITKYVHDPLSPTPSLERKVRQVKQAVKIACLSFLFPVLVEVTAGASRLDILNRYWWTQEDQRG